MDSITFFTYSRDISQVSTAYLHIYFTLFSSIILSDYDMYMQLRNAIKQRVNK
jgi:hypothetical protein